MELLTYSWTFLFKHVENFYKYVFEPKLTTMPGSKISNVPEKHFCGFLYIFGIKEGTKEGGRNQGTE